MATDKITQHALRAGDEAAKRVLKQRKKALTKRRSFLLARAAAVPRPAVARGRAPSVRAEAAPTTKALSWFGAAQSSGVLVAEGDSWFDYPWTDVLEELEDGHGYDVYDVARAGDRIEDMAYEDGQLAKFARNLEKVLRDGKVPSAVLLSGGGNDIAGDDFHTVLNHATSPSPGLNEAVVRGLVDERVRAGYLTILAGITGVMDRYLTVRVPIVLHGYDYAVPDGRGFMGGWGPLPGPWLDPGFTRKGYNPKTQGVVRRRIVRDLIDRFNDMLSGVAKVPELKHVRYVDLRGTLPTGANYDDWWANELHPTPDGFEKVAAKFAATIAMG